MGLSGATAPDKPLLAWVVADGRAGIENQALGLAEAVARLSPRPVEIVVKRLRWRAGLRRLPTRLVLSARGVLARGSAPLKPPWPDLWIAAGRASIPGSIAVRRWSRGATFVVQVQDPLRPPRLFDLVVPPTHDRLAGPGVFPILGSPHRVTPERLAQARGAFSARLDPLPRPLTAVLVGGRSKAYDLPPDRARVLAADLLKLQDVTGGALLLTFSRRTPPEAEAILREALAGRPGWIWDGTGDNPYFAFLGAADRILVTADSINMVAEAASTGRPVQILPMAGGQARKDRFHADLLARGAARPFAGRAEDWTYAPLRETERAANEVLARMARRARAAPDLRA